MFARLASLCLLVPTALASIPGLSGYRTVFSDDFNGIKGGLADGSKWNQVTTPNAANLQQIQIYTDRASNAHLSGDGQLYIVPKKSGVTTKYWTSARLESVGSWKCPPGKAMLLQSELRIPDFTGSPSKYDGMWPAFWTKGQSCREGSKWPACGEWDIFETTNKMSNRNQGTLHFQNPDGTHNGGFQGSINYKGGEYHTWAFKVDRRNSDWKKQSLTWYMDGTRFYSVTGAMVGAFDQWKVLAQSPYYVIFNLALGGKADSYGGLTTDNTVDGFEGSMRIKYVAVYESS
ncbi:glycoside hydrolase family 16 protein [Thelonectria olida]|uniref:Glycoside hydrolase family 16 protein n=1 Tax=Thelonectria olida TaxID=1576542 RepID=A0A9P8VQ45_9HYPO|nr:glycoside hydrolase family 16 protein [Thelonectria olida]